MPGSPRTELASLLAVPKRASSVAFSLSCSEVHPLVGGPHQLLLRLRRFALKGSWPTSVSVRCLAWVALGGCAHLLRIWDRSPPVIYHLLPILDSSGWIGIRPLICTYPVSESPHPFEEKHIRGRFFPTQTSCRVRFTSLVGIQTVQPQES